MDAAHWVKPSTWEAIAWWAQAFAWSAAALGVFLGVLAFWAKSNVAYLKEESLTITRAMRDARTIQRLPTKEDARALFAKLSPYAGGHFWIVTETNDYDQSSEQMRFSKQLRDILVDAGWVELQTPGIKETPLPAYKRVTGRGIAISFLASDEGDKAVAEAVVSALAELDIASSMEPLDDLAKRSFIFWVGLR